MIGAPQLLRVLSGLLVAVLAAAVLKVAFLDLSTSPVGSLAQVFASSLGNIFLYGFPLAIAPAVLLEIIRVRRVHYHIGFGIAVAFLVAHLRTRNEALSSFVYSNGALTALAVIAIGALSASVYWAAAGRWAGWRDERSERSELLAAQAYATASAAALTDRCTRCLAVWAAIAFLVFATSAWLSIGVAGLRDSVIHETVTQGNLALAAEQPWAKFAVDDDHGFIEGQAPDEVQSRAAFENVRTALNSVIGFPGVLSRMENRTTAQVSLATVSQQLAEAKRREKEAKSAVEEARAAREAALAAEQDAKRRADEQAAIIAENKRTLEEQARSTAEASKPALALAEPSKPADQNVSAAGSESTGQPEASGEAVPKSDDPLHPALDACTTQDVAKIESSQVFFARQQFEVLASYDSDLDSLAASARACAPRSLQISGHAGAADDSLFNVSLSFQRAVAVRESLTARGVDASFVIVKGTKFDPDAKTGEDSDQNQKVDFHVLEAAATSRDATQSPDERVANCQSDLEIVTSQSIVHFATASARINQESTALIKGIANAIQKCGSVIVTVEGHTDKIGTPVHNQELSEARANTVVEALIAAGADPTRIRSRGFASNQPYDAGDTAEAFALNRRIEFKVSGKFASASTGGP